MICSACLLDLYSERLPGALTEVVKLVSGGVIPAHVKMLSPGWLPLLSSAMPVSPVPILPALASALGPYFAVRTHSSRSRHEARAGAAVAFKRGLAQDTAETLWTESRFGQSRHS